MEQHPTPAQLAPAFLLGTRWTDHLNHSVQFLIRVPSEEGSLPSSASATKIARDCDSGNFHDSSFM
jgi:hypothetical protein